MHLTKEQQCQVDLNRARYEELKAVGQKNAPRALPVNTPRDAAAPVESKIIRREIVPGGWYWTTRLDRGDALRLINVTGASCISVLAWNADDRSERLNHADTIKVQWAANLQKGRVILSDMGRVLFSIVEDTSGKHDAVVGGSSPESNRTRYGAGRRRNTRENFISATAKLGLDRRDVHPCVSFFAPVSVGADGQFKWNVGVRQAGDFVDLRAEMDLLVALSNCPHPMDPSPDYAPGDVEIVRFRSAPAKSDDLCRTASAENIRAFENNALAEPSA
jgi:urea carboxylase-associated protein 2